LTLIRPLFLAMAALVALWAVPSFAADITLQSPLDCTLGTDCFVQQLPDMDSGPGTTDPFCGMATYEGHDGLDLRVRSMADVAAGVAVQAVAAGKVLRARDGEPDHLMMTEADRAAVAKKECGNGVVIRHEGGYETQYCHMKQGSIIAKAGDDVAQGQKLGEVGASGAAQFPHVHLTVRKNGEKVDPLTDKAVGSGCDPAAVATETLWDPATGLTSPITNSILALGFAAAPIRGDTLVVDGPPPPPDTSSPGFIAYAWLINLHEKDIVEMQLKSGDGTVLTAQKLPPLDHSKATFTAFVGKKRPPVPGSYTVTATVWRDGQKAIEQTASIDIH
jgi:hypothetical protein